MDKVVFVGAESHGKKDVSVTLVYGNRVLFQQDRTVRFNNKIDSLLAYKKWFFGHWHTSWGYDNRKTSKYIPLFSSGFVITP